MGIYRYQLRWTYGIILLVLLVCTGCTDTLPACEDSLGCEVIRPNEPIEVAAILALSGNASSLGQDSLQGVELALMARGYNLLNHEIVLSTYDSGCREQMGQIAAQNVRNKGTILGVIGPNCSDIAALIHPIIHNGGLVMVSPSATDPGLTDFTPETTVSHQGSFFRTSPNNLQQAQVAAEFAYEVIGLRTAVTVHDGTTYSRTLQQQFSQSFQRLGGLVIFQGVIPVGEPEIQDLLAELTAEKPDLFYLPIFAPEANLVANRLLEINALAELHLIGADSLLYPEFPISAGTAVTGMYLSGTAVPETRYIQFVRQWEDRLGSESVNANHAYAYDATNILLEAIEQAAISSSNGTLQIGRQALRGIIAATKEYPGSTGSISCTSFGDCAAAGTVGIYELTNDEVSGVNWPPALIWPP
jgi:branched-chain amino acid transport system substrate-binding protein